MQYCFIGEQQEPPSHLYPEDWWLQHWLSWVHVPGIPLTLGRRQQVLLLPQVRHGELEVKPRSLQPQQGSELLQFCPATGHVRGGGVGAGGGGGGVALGSSQQL